MLSQRSSSEPEELRPSEGLLTPQSHTNTAPAQAEPEPAPKVVNWVAALLTLGLILTLVWATLLGWLGARLITRLLP
jgi:hypothetical protein